MSELKTNLEQILQEKNEKIISQNIKKDVEVLGVTGSYDKEDIKELQDELADAEQELADVKRDLDNSTATISGSGEAVTLNGTAEARFKKAPLPLGNTEQEVIEAQAGTTVEGESISASGVDLSKVEILNINGNTRQETTTGKNKIISFKTRNSDFVEYFFDKSINNSFIMSGLSNLTVSGFKVTIKTSNGDINLGYKNIETNKNFSFTFSITTDDLSKIQNSTSTPFIQFWSSAGFTEADFKNVMIRDSSITDDTYEPYTGGIASPNPDYPQEMHSAGANINLLDISQVMIGKAWNNASNNARAVAYIKCEPSTTYTISFNNISNFDGVYNFEKTSPEDTTAIVGVSQITATKTITTNANSSYLGIQFNKSNISASDFAGLKIKIEKGDKATAYSEFGQGCASVVVENKNKLAYPDISSITFGNITFAHDKGIYTISTDGTSTTPTSTDVYPIENYTIQEGDYIHYNNSFIDSHIGISLRFSDNTNVFNSFASSTNRIISLSNYVGKTITAIGFNWNTGYTFTGTCKPMITNSSTATDYVAHEGQNFIIPTQAPFRKIGDYKDTFVKKVDGKWYEKHVIGEVILDGSEDWGNLTQIDTSNYYRYENIDFRTNNCLEHSAYLSDKFIYSTNTMQQANVIGNSNVAGANRLWITIDTSLMNGTTENDFKTWLSNHNTKVNYVQKEPTYIECTQEQSDILNQINTFYETTNIFSTDEISPNFTFTYNKVYSSPSPDDESPIQTVSGDVEVKVQNKNLLDFSNLSTTSNTTYTFNNDIINATSSSGSYKSCSKDILSLLKNNSGKTLKFVCDSYDFSNAGGINATAIVQVTVTKNGKKIYSTLMKKDGTNITYTIPNDTSDITDAKLNILPNNSTSTGAYSLSITKPMLQFDLTSTNYVKHKEQILPLALKSKNLFNINKLNQVSDYNTYDNLTKLWYTSTVSSYARSIFYSVAGAGHNVDITKVQKVKPNTTYTIKFYNYENTSGYGVIQLYYYEATGKYISKTPDISKATCSNGYTFTTPVDCEYIDIIRVDNNGRLIFSSIQLEQGSIATSYEPYYNYELCKIGDYQDNFWKDETTSKWYLHKETGKVVLDGSENWGTSSTSTSGVYRPVCSVLNGIIKAPISSSNLPEVLCNYYKSITNDQSYTKVEGISISISGRIEIYDSNYNTNDISLYKTWLNTHDLILYYVLKTPTDTEITDTILINQLEAIRKAISYDEQTNVSSNTIALFDIIALRNMNTILNTLENDVDLLE